MFTQIMAHYNRRKFTNSNKNIKNSVSKSDHDFLKVSNSILKYSQRIFANFLKITIPKETRLHRNRISIL